MKKSWINKVLNAVKNLFSDLFDLAEEKAPQAVIIGQVVKNAVEKHGATIQALSTITKTGVDDKSLKFINEKLPVLVQEIAVIDGLVDKDTPVDVAFEKYFGYVMGKTKESKSKEIIFLVAQILMWILGKKLPMPLATIVTQKAYQLLFGKNA